MQAVKLHEKAAVHDGLRQKTINKDCNRTNSGARPEFVLPALSAALNPVIYVCVNSRIYSLDALPCSLS